MRLCSTTMITSSVVNVTKSDTVDDGILLLTSDRVWSVLHLFR